MTALAHDDYIEFCEGVRRLSAVDLLQYKRPQMERRIRSFASRRGISGLHAYLDELRTSTERLSEFLDHVTINVSQLWRNPEQWSLLAREVVPELAQERRIRAWSAGCSYGAESYTLAAVCLEAAPHAQVRVHGTDIDRRMVERAREGRFSAEDVRDASRTSLERWFVPDGRGWRARDELRHACSFDVGDLLRMRFPVAAYDLVLCRNTVIYFTEEVRDALHERLVDTLRPGGYLMIGSTERVSRPRELGLVSSHPFTYRKG